MTFLTSTTTAFAAAIAICGIKPHVAAAAFVAAAARARLFALILTVVLFAVSITSSHLGSCGQPWNGSAAKKLLREDIDEDLHKQLEPKDFR